MTKKKEDDDIVYEKENKTKKTSFSSDSILKLKQKIKELEKEKKEYLNGWQITRADLINLKKEFSEKEKIFTEIGKINFLEDIIPILDNFEAAFSNKKAWEKTPKEWRVGIEYVYNQFINVLEKNEVNQFCEIGDVFDEKLHISLESIKTKKKKEKEKIAQIIQKGYKIKEKIIRPAKVKIFI